ncbi:hypothetical protein EJB05_39421 [Eragrostis curvula]|uniref:Uncharacterized protein n=1 Tax=Eragrostis curvula TaxID=38414 RepID=A0A5J9TWX3_9POAL|nr:hypothetical protein EJB05_39421 [Eragrostis curvula]
MDQSTSISLPRDHDETGMEQVQSDLEALTKLYGLLHKGPAYENLDVTSRALLMRMLEDATKQALQMRMTDETGMEQAQSDLEALNKLYGLLHKGPTDENLDEASRALLMRMLDDATKQALFRQTKMISGPLMPAVPERNLSTRSVRRTPASSPRRSLNPLASPSLISLHQPSERSRRLNLQDSASSSRDGRHVHGVRHNAVEEPVLSRLGSNRSSKTAVPLSRLASNRSSRTAVPPPRHRQSGERQHSGLSLYRLPMASTSQHGTVTGTSQRAGLPDMARPSYARGDHLSLERSTSRHGKVTGTSRHDDLGDRTRPNYGRGDHSSLERGSVRPSVSRELSRRLEQTPTPRRVGAEGSSSTRHFGKQGSGLSLGVTSRRGSERAGRGGAATSRHSSSASSDEVATIRSRITPHRELTERSLRRQAEEEEEEEEGSTRRLRRLEYGAISSAAGRASRSSKPQRRALNRIDSVGTYSISSAGAASSVRYTGLSASPASSASDSSYSSPPVSRWGRRARPAYPYEAPADSLRDRGARPAHEHAYEAPADSWWGRGVRSAYANEASADWRRRRRERLERRVGRIRKIKEKFAMLFHHRHDHHHHHHHNHGHDQEGPSRRDVVPHNNRKSLWKHLGGVFHHTKGKDKKKTMSQTGVSVPPPKKRGGGGGGVGHLRSLFGAMQHLRGKRKAPKAKTPASVKMMNKGFQKQIKRMHWWQQLRKRSGRGKGKVAGSKPRRRLGFGKGLKLL